jgi:hypothetical protein
MSNSDQQRGWSWYVPRTVEVGFLLVATDDRTCAQRQLKIEKNRERKRKRKKKKREREREREKDDIFNRSRRLEKSRRHSLE